MYHSLSWKQYLGAYLCEMTRDFFYIFSTYLLAFLTLAVAVTSFLTEIVPRWSTPTTMALFLVGFLVSNLRLYKKLRSELDEYRRGPELECSKNLQWSEPSDEQKEMGIKGTWFLRVEIKNTGKTLARECVGRLLEVHRMVENNSELIDKFDPMHLYWRGQKEWNDYRPSEIHGPGDSSFLDIARFSYVPDPPESHGFSKHLKPGLRLIFRIVISENEPLIRGGDSAGPDVDSLGQKYRVKIGFYAENALGREKWFEIKCPESLSENHTPYFEEVPPEQQSPISEHRLA